MHNFAAGLISSSQAWQLTVSGSAAVERSLWYQLNDFLKYSAAAIEIEFLIAIASSAVLAFDMRSSSAREVPLAEIVNLKKPSLVRADHTSPSQLDKQLLDVVEVDYAIRKAGNRLHESVVRPWTNADATLFRDRMSPSSDGCRVSIDDLANLLVREDRGPGRTFCT
jgi:hypothetical protein